MSNLYVDTVQPFSSGSLTLISASLQGLANISSSQVLYYNTASGEVYYDDAPAGGSSVSASFATSASRAISAACSDKVSNFNVDQPDPQKYFYTAMGTTGSGCQDIGTLDEYSLYYDGSTNRNISPVDLQGNLIGTASFAITASYALNATGSNANIYNTDGTLDDNRTVTFGGNNLAFVADSGETFEIASDPASDVLISGLPSATTNNVVYYNTTNGKLTYGPALSGSITGSGDSFPYTGSAIISGSLAVTGSYKGNIVNLNVVSDSASLDLAAGNAFTITLTTGSTYISASNIDPNQKFSLLISSSFPNATINFEPTQFYLPSNNNPYLTTNTTGSRDILTFESYVFNPNVLVNTSIAKDLEQAIIPEFIVATGGTVETSGSYKIHTFTTSGTFTVTSPGNLSEFLIVAGGGGGGSAHGGGGGGGGLIYDNSEPFLSAGSYTVTVGGGGSGGAPVYNKGGVGSNSSFNSNTAFGGGGGGAYGDAGIYSEGLNGGSGGGGGGETPGTGGTGSVGQGNDGGNAVGSPGQGGGGGGAGVAGESADSGSFAPGGGDGLAYNFTGSSVYYAGGGGGGAYTVTFGGEGGLGGGGNGGDQGNNPGANGTANRGGGGGGGSDFTPGGGNGGSGIVIIKYKFQA